MPAEPSTDAPRHDALAGVDALDAPVHPHPRRAAVGWAASWPKLAAAGIALGAWQLVVATHWRPPSVFPGPGPVLRALGGELRTGTFWTAVTTTMRRAGEGYLVAIGSGLLLGVAVSRVRSVRAALGALITGLQTMPSIAWLPFAVLAFSASERAILFVVVLGAAPAIANGVLAGVDYVPAVLIRCGRSLGARGWTLYRHVILPAALPAIVAGLKQGWAFAWRSLMAAELLVGIAHRPSLGGALELARDHHDATALLSSMLVIGALGVLVDAVFATANGVVRRMWGTSTD
ncbi:MAG TPA: ABC transporter permease [Mycobacteriales bacterium]|nr:ABC transporter permease [Mycobacteriales bacterium]